MKHNTRRFDDIDAAQRYGLCNIFYDPGAATIALGLDNVARNQGDQTERWLAINNDSINTSPQPAFLAGEYLTRTVWSQVDPLNNVITLVERWITDAGVVLPAPAALADLVRIDGLSPDVVSALQKNNQHNNFNLVYRAKTNGPGWAIGNRIAIINFFDNGTKLRSATKAYNITNDPAMVYPMAVLPLDVDLGPDVEAPSTAAALVQMDWQRPDPSIEYQAAITLPANTSIQIFAAQPQRQGCGFQVIAQNAPSDVVYSYGSPVVVTNPPNYRTAVGGAYGGLSAASDAFTRQSIHAWCAEASMLMLWERIA